MPNLIVVYWRDIPAQIIVGKGRNASKIQLSERFEQAIDRCAMKIDAKDSDAYLAEWRKSDPLDISGSSEEVAKSHAEKIEKEYNKYAEIALKYGIQYKEKFNKKTIANNILEIYRKKLTKNLID